MGIVSIVLGVADHAETPDRDKLIGSWTDQGRGESRSTWTLAGSGESLRITQTQNERTVGELECNTAEGDARSSKPGSPSWGYRKLLRRVNPWPTR